jgi:hypothetical protein
MRLKKPFRLSHVALYSKGWYETSDDVVSDLIKILKLDDYSPFDKNDVLRILLSNYEESFEINLIDFISSINQHNCWKHGYYTKNCEWVKEHETLPEYDMYMAVIYKILSDIRFIERNSWVVKFPKYSKNLKRPEHIKIRTLFEFFGKKNKS